MVTYHKLEVCAHIAQNGYGALWVTRGVGQPKKLADRLLKSIDLKISQSVKACQERNNISVWKLGK
eukprot:1156847-Pelagomonas_calceolata.AAC.1